MSSYVYIAGQALHIPDCVKEELLCHFGEDWDNPNNLLYWLLNREFTKAALENNKRDDK